MRWWEWSDPDAGLNGGLYPPPPPQTAHVVAESEAEDVVRTLTSSAMLGAKEVGKQGKYGLGGEKK
jgi:hypothetical protein